MFIFPQIPGVRCLCCVVYFLLLRACHASQSALVTSSADVTKGPAPSPKRTASGALAVPEDAQNRKHDNLQVSDVTAVSRSSYTITGFRPLGQDGGT